MKTLLLLLSLILTFTEFVADDEVPPIVETPNGRIQGNFQKSYGGRTFTAFEGVPYAKPPVGDLRFKEPMPAEKWDDILIADKTYTCAQYLPIPGMGGVKGQEDCLYVYVYVPRENITPGENLPVVIHIHGGAFMVGSPKLLALPDYLMDKDLIYVSLNYRVGILGFLSTADSACPGNNGLKDQSLALRWIKDNIKYFGGNPDSITLTGESAGSASVQFHYISKWSQGLFHRGISQSGSVLNSWAIVSNPLKNAKSAAVSLNCNTEDTRKMVDCMREKPLNDLVQSYRDSMIIRDVLPLISFGPVVEKEENSFLPEHPYKLLQDGKIFDVPLIHSVVAHEGVLFVGMLAFSGKLKLIKEDWEKYAPHLFSYDETVSEDEIRNDISMKIRDFYIKNTNTTDDEYSDMLSQAFTDRFFLTGAEKAIRLHAKAVKSPVYFYIFDYILQQPFLLPIKQRSTHTDDLRLYLKTFMNPVKLKEVDEMMMKLFTDFIYEYALKGIPRFGDVEWKPLQPGAPEIDYLLIGSPTNVTMKSMKELAPNQFWDSLPIQENNHLFP